MSPSACDPASSPTASGPDAGSSSSSVTPITVMIVDDQRATRMGLSLIINRADDLRVVAEAAHGQDALDQLADLCQERRPLPDVVLMDVRMPVLNGIDATARISQLYPSIRVLVLTTYDQDEFAFGALSAGASGFLLKDTRTAQLHQALRAVSSGDAILTPRITRELLNRHMLRPVASPQQRVARRRLGGLSPREREVADLVSQGLTNAEIAQRLVLAPDSVKKNVTRILTKLDLRDRVQLVILMRDAQS
ncbi:response regulator transcription factor [Actinomyces naeslundii]|uniref:Response regulator transcription factor n=1 Tax=Actinomyces naeslundii TaxID=1655 RepID=A0AA47ILN5_ACTNA|nr:response regulator transcription factor [Actinomyces naeslundii]WAL42902.1 response regulator transcription factor [Actinomyces naeslundii]